MATTKIFISSTCYDLSVLRAELRNFIKALGHEPVMSEFADVLYDPRIHTHTSCVNEVVNCDMLIVIIGSRFGGKSVPEAISKIDLSILENTDKNTLKEDDVRNISITQLEVLTALENNIPVYTFIENKVYYEHEVYEKNKDNPDIKKIFFPAIEKQETAPYIFDFLNYIRLKSSGNYFFKFEKLQDIEEALKKQWSGYFQKLLYEQRNKEETSRQIDVLTEQFEDLKTAILSSIANIDQREVANGIVRFRRLMDVLMPLAYDASELCESSYEFMQILNKQGIHEVIDCREVFPSIERPSMYGRTFLMKNDGTFYETRLSKDAFFELEKEWNLFKQIKKESKKIIIEALKEMHRPTMLIRYHKERFEEYIDKQMNKEYRKAYAENI